MINRSSSDRIPTRHRSTRSNTRNDYQGDGFDHGSSTQPFQNQQEYHPPFPTPIPRSGYLPITALTDNPPNLNQSRCPQPSPNITNHSNTRNNFDYTTPTQSRRGNRIHPPPPINTHSNNSIMHNLQNQELELSVGIPLPPPPPADNLPIIGNGGGQMNLSGFQTDYSRVLGGEDNLRRAPNSDEIRSTVQLKRKIQIESQGERGEGVERGGREREKEIAREKEKDTEREREREQEETNKPVPAEAYIIMRHHRIPNKIWNDGIEKEMREADEWTYELHLVQQPTRGKALGLLPLPRGWPALSAPLIVQLIVKDQKDKMIPVDMAVDLVSEDGTESRSFMRVRPCSQPNKSPSLINNQPKPEIACGSQRNLLGSLHRSANTYILDGKKGIYFLFTELVVRNVGKFALRVSLFDLAGPSHLGTSIGITQTISTALTQPFTVYHATEFPGALPVTDLSMEFTRQGERNLGRRTRADVSSEDDSMNNPDLSPEVQTNPNSIHHNNLYQHHPQA